MKSRIEYLNSTPHPWSGGGVEVEKEFGILGTLVYKFYRFEKTKTVNINGLNLKMIFCLKVISIACYSMIYKSIY
jgi:hypothetical protein